MKADHFVETKSQNRAPSPLLFIPLTSPQRQRENNIVCRPIYNYVNMSNRVSVVKTDFRFCTERGVVAGSHHSPESLIIIPPAFMPRGI